MAAVTKIRTGDTWTLYRNGSKWGEDISDSNIDGDYYLAKVEGMDNKATLVKEWAAKNSKG